MSRDSKHCKHHDVHTPHVKKRNTRSNPTNRFFFGCTRLCRLWVSLNDHPPSIFLFDITKLEHPSPITLSLLNASLQLFIYLRVRLQVFAPLAIDRRQSLSDEIRVDTC